MKGFIGELRNQRISLAVAFVALVLAVGGGAFAGAAATRLITGRQIKNGTINSADIKNGGVRSADIARGQVQAGDIGRGQVRAASIGPDQVTAAAIAPDQVGGKQIAPESIGSGEVASSAVGSTELANGAVQSSDIGTGQVGSAEIANGQVTPQDVTMPEPVQLQRPADAPPAEVRISGTDYTHITTIGAYNKQDAGSALEISWTGTAQAYSAAGPSPCVFQVRIDGQASAGAGEVFVAFGSPVSVSTTSLFEGLGTGARQVEIWARIPNTGGGVCTVGPVGTDVAQTVVVGEKIL